MKAIWNGTVIAELDDTVARRPTESLQSTFEREASDVGFRVS